MRRLRKKKIAPAAISKATTLGMTAATMVTVLREEEVDAGDDDDGDMDDDGDKVWDRAGDCDMVVVTDEVVGSTCSAV